MTDINNEIDYNESLRAVIKETIVGICEKNINAYPNICRYGSRSKSDQYALVEKVFGYMTDKTIPMELEQAINMVDSELQPGFGD